MTECRGNTRRTSSLISPVTSAVSARNARGRVPATSPSPPTFTKGSASAARNKMLMVWDMSQLYIENQETLKSIFNFCNIKPIDFFESWYTINLTLLKRRNHENSEPIIPSDENLAVCFVGACVG